MAVSGRLTTKTGAYTYKVVQYQMKGKRALTRGATPEKLDSNDIQFARFYIQRKGGDPESGIYTTLWGPFLSRDVIEGELTAQMDDDAYGELVG